MAAIPVWDARAGGHGMDSEGVGAAHPELPEAAMPPGRGDDA